MRQARLLIAVLLTSGLVMVQSAGPVHASTDSGTAGTNCSSDGTNWTCTWNTHGSYAWNAPVGLSSVSVDVRGASGGVGSGSQQSLLPGGGGPGGTGGEVQGTLLVTPGTVLTLQVGGAGGNAVAFVPGYQGGSAGAAGFGGGGSGAGINGVYADSFGGGGGGASLIATSASSPADLVVGAGGGGGSGETYSGDGWGGGYAGYPYGGSGASAAASPQFAGDCHWGAGGGGGTQSAGGAGGTGGADAGYSCPDSYLNGKAGSAGTGGNAASYYIGGGGGGGGYYGGGGGGAGEQTGAGGGGSSYADASLTNAAFSTLNQFGEGSITITYPIIASHTTVMSSASPSTYESPVTFTATVDQPNVAGTMQFQVDGTNLGSPAQVSGGIATVTTATLDVGNHTITAIYSGDPTAGAAPSSGTVNQTVTAAASNLTTTSWTTPGTYSWTVPNGVNWVAAAVRGASGGHGSGSGLYYQPGWGSGGQGGDVLATLHVTPGQVLTVRVGGAGGDGVQRVYGISIGGAGAGGYGGGGNGDGAAYLYMGGFGGGGGGSSLIATTDATPVNLLIGAGGGGGSGYSQGNGAPGGNAGYPAGSPGSAGGGYYGGAGGGGGGGSQTAGGSGGAAGTQSVAGSAGRLGTGGYGSKAVSGGGGGGGGYYGGGGGGGAWGYATGGGGGGGSSHADGSIIDSRSSTSSQSGNGAVSFSYPRALTTTVLTVSSASGTFAGTATLSATLTSATTPVSGESITFTLNGNAVCGGSGQPACPPTDSNGVATLSGVSLSGINAGTDSGAVGASFAGDSTYSSSITSGDLSVAQAGQTITFNALPTATYGDSPITVSAAGGGSTSAVTFSAIGNCSSSGTHGVTITVTGAGSCTVTASQLGDSNYTAATDVSQTFTIAKASATIALDAGSLSATYDGSRHLATATTTPSGLSYSVSYTDAAGNAVTAPTNASSYGVTASVTDPNYTGSTEGTLVIAKANQSIAVTGHAPSSAAYGATFTVAATPSSGLDVAYGSNGACTNSGATFTMQSGSGTCTVTYDQAGNGNYNVAGEVTETVTAQKAAQTITFGSLANHTYGDSPVQLSATASSGSTVSYAVGSTDACTVAGNTVTITGAGSCTVTASQAGDGNYNPAQSVSQTFSIARAATTTTATTSLSPSTVGQSVTFTATVVPTTGSAIPSGSVTFKDGLTILGTGTLSGGTATFTTSGLFLGGHTITAGYTGDSNYQASSSAALAQNVDTSLVSYPKLSNGTYNLTSAGLAGAYLAGANLAGAIITSANLSGANLTGANLAGANLTSANLSNANLTGANLKGANLSSANLTNADLSRADLTNANLTKTNLKGATGLSTATLAGVIWSKTTCPDNTVSTNDGGTCLGHL